MTLITKWRTFNFYGYVNLSYIIREHTTTTIKLSYWKLKESINKTRLLYIYNIIWYIYWRGAHGIEWCINIEEICMHFFDNHRYVLDQNAQCTFYQLGAFDKHNYNLYTYIRVIRPKQIIMMQLNINYSDSMVFDSNNSNYLYTNKRIFWMHINYWLDFDLINE